jgi:hypothetical protein
MMKLASGSVSGEVTCVSRIVASCDFGQLWRLPLSLSAAGKRLILMLKKIHQVIFSRLAGYENRREQTTVVL